MSNRYLVMVFLSALFLVANTKAKTGSNQPGENGYVDLSNPELWVLYSLTDKPETIHRPGTVKKLITQLGQLGSSNAGVSPATGIEIAPWRLDDAANDSRNAMGWFNVRNIQVGVATGFDSSGYRSGVGVKWTLFDGSDAQNDEKFMTNVHEVYNTALSDNILGDLQDSAYVIRQIFRDSLDSELMITLAQPTNVKRHSDEQKLRPDQFINDSIEMLKARKKANMMQSGTDTAKLKKLLDTLDQYKRICLMMYGRFKILQKVRIDAAHKQVLEAKRVWADSNWNRGFQLTVGFGANVHSLNGYVNDIRSIRTPFLLSASHGIGQYVQVVLSGQYALSLGSYSDSLCYDYSLGSQLILGTARVRPYLQIMFGESKYSIGRGEGIRYTAWSAGLDLRVAENFWMNIGGGERQQFATGGNTTYPLIKYGIRVNFTESE